MPAAEGKSRPQPVKCYNTAVSVQSAGRCKCLSEMGSTCEDLVVGEGRRAALTQDEPDEAGKYERKARIHI